MDRCRSETENDHHCREQAGDHRRLRHPRGRHGLARGPGGDLDPPHPRPDRAPEGAPEGFRLAARLVDDGWPAASSAGLPAPDAGAALPEADRAAGLAALRDNGPDAAGERAPTTEG